MRVKLFLKKYYPELAGLIVFLIYFSTVSRSINEFDSGELATVQTVWGVAHPTGYPFFSILGYTFSKLPLPFTTIFKLNFLCVIWNTLTVIFLIKIVKCILENINNFVTDKDKNKLNWLINNNNYISVIAIISGFSFAFSITFWEQATRVEVYSLQLFLTSAIIYFSLKEFISIKTDDKKNVSRNLLIVSIFLGLAFSNHMMTLYLLPALLYLFFKHENFNKKSTLLLFKLGTITFLIAVSFYLLMMFRAQMSPLYMFGNPSSLSTMIDHVRGENYNKFMFSGLGTVKKQSTEFLKILSFNPDKQNFIGGEFSLMIVFIFPGIIFSAIFFKRIFTWAILLIITSLFFAFNYSIPDINEYFLVVFFCFSIMISISLIILLSFFKAKSFKLVIIFLATIFVALQLVLNYKPLNRKNDHFVEDYAKALLNSIPDRSFLISYNWDYVISPDFYIQNVELYRKDVNVIIINWLEKKWYKNDIKKNYKSLKEFLKNDYYITFDIINKFISKKKFDTGPGSYIIPDILTFKVVHDKNYHPARSPDFKIRFKKNRNEDEDYYYTLIAWILENRAEYELSFNKLDRAKIYINKILSDYPDYKLSNKLKNLVSKQNHKELTN